MSVRRRSSEYSPQAGLHCSPAGSNPPVNPNRSTAVRNSLWNGPHPSHPNDVPETFGVDVVAPLGAEVPLGVPLAVPLGDEIPPSDVGAVGTVRGGGPVPVQAAIAETASASTGGRTRCTRGFRTPSPSNESRKGSTSRNGPGVGVPPLSLRPSQTSIWQGTPGPPSGHDRWRAGSEEPARRGSRFAS